MLGIIGLILAIVVLIYGAYKGLGALPLTMLAALVAIVFNGIPLWEGYATHYMTGYTSAYMSYFLMFACSSLYAKLMDVRHRSDISLSTGLEPRTSCWLRF